ncbi:MAG: hypothetical protein WKG01_33670 [Kofleriaceae bacterium]
MRMLLVIGIAGCTAASPDPGLGALLQVEGAQYRPGAFPADDGGPGALALATSHAAIPIGTFRERIDGTLEPTARTTVIGIDGIDDTWLVPAAPPDFDAPDLASAKATIGLAPGFPPGPFVLRIAAADRDGRFGAAATYEAIAAPEEPPTGELVIALIWQGRADLDVHVVDPLGGEAWSDDPNTYVPPAPGDPPDPPEAWRGFGILDHDGNKDCRRDASPGEHVIWTVPPPGGEYVVRVDARAMCGDGSAAWFVAAYRDGELVGAARGVAVPDDTLLPHGAGAGVRALRFAL